MEQKWLWCQQLKKSIIDNYEAVIPDKARQLVMSLGADSVAEGGYSLHLLACTRTRTHIYK